ncbi:MAG: tetratricopeptide repeat protein [Bacteroidetes bacterium]|nr:tetratricopeptide repeat protein [Bacteroidota bacterium]
MKKSFSVLSALIILAACAVTDPNIETAKLNVKNGEYEKAIESVGKAIEIDPANGSAYEYRGNILGELAQKKNNPSDRSELYNKMVQDYSKATELYKMAPDAEAKSLLMENNMVRYWANEFNAGVKLVQGESPTSEQLSKAVVHLKNAVSIMPDSLNSQTTLAEIQYMNKDLEGAIASLSKAIDMNKTPEVNLYLRLAAFQDLAGSKNQSIETLKKAKELFLDNIDIVQSLANAYLSTNDIENALAAVKTLIERDPENAQYRLVYGTQLYNTTDGLTTEAEANYERISILKKDLKNAKGKKAQAMVKNELDSLRVSNQALNKQINELTDQALVQMKVVTELKPDDASALYTTGIIIQNRAANLFKERDSTEDNKRAAKLDTEAKDVLRDALVYYEKAIELKPEETEYWMTLFKVYTTLGMTDKAQQAMEKAGL